MDPQRVKPLVKDLLFASFRVKQVEQVKFRAAGFHPYAVPFQHEGIFFRKKCKDRVSRTFIEGSQQPVTVSVTEIAVGKSMQDPFAVGVIHKVIVRVMIKAERFGDEFCQTVEAPYFMMRFKFGRVGPGLVAVEKHFFRCGYINGSFRAEQRCSGFYREKDMVFSRPDFTGSLVIVDIPSAFHALLPSCYYIYYIVFSGNHFVRK